MEEIDKLYVNYIHYIDNKKSSNLTGFQTNIFEDVVSSKIQGDFVHIIQRLSNGNLKQTFIPVSNVGLIEAFNDEDDFYEAYPNVARRTE